MKKIPTYVINLDRSPNRLDYVTRQLSKIGLPFERIVAIDGSKIETKSLEFYQQQSRHSWIHYATLSAGEVGCALSWHCAWQIVSEHESKACTVLEDDIKIHSNFCNTINTLFENLDENIIIDLSGKKGSIEKERRRVGDITLIRYQTPPLKNQGSIYGRNAAKVFLEKIQNFKAPVDTLQQMLWKHNIQTWSLEKGCLSHQDFDVGGSTITTRKKNLLTKIKNELSRPLWRMWIVIRNLL